MAVLNEQVRERVRREFEGLEEGVRLVVFTQEFECEHCRENTSLAREVASLSDKLDVEVYNFALDKEAVERYGVDKIPAIVVEGEKDYGIRFYGVPSGYEFASFLEAIKAVSAGKSGLSPETKEALRGLKEPIHLQVVVTLPDHTAPWLCSWHRGWLWRATWCGRTWWRARSLRTWCRNTTSLPSPRRW